MVVFGPDFEVLFKNDAMFVMMGYTECKEKGLFAGLTVPPEGKLAVEMVKHAKFSEAAQALKQLSDRGSVGDFKKELGNRLDALRGSKRELFDRLEKDGKKWEAFKVGSSYTRVFSQAKDCREVGQKVNGWQVSDPEVKKNFEAQQVFANLLAQIYGPKSKPAYLAQAKTTFRQFADKYKDTEFAKPALDLALALELATAK